ncbi:phage holin [Avibacterium sp. 20-129]|uniref:phage holin n=1 Tax=Avibacterium sp. 20-129 TaxID=2911525 RepID=UPI0022483150|nr:phage holin [Avibacterium sp. 20-129]MCW9699825.1 phage holin family protein [Avibacterium sp. 20-129]
MHDTTTKVSYTGAGVTFFMGRIADMFSNINWADAASIVGIVMGIATFAINWYYKKKDFELKKQELEGRSNAKKTH